MQTLRVLWGSLALSAILCGHAQAALSPIDTVKETILTVIGIINDPVFVTPDMSEPRRDAIERVVTASVSYEDMARRTLGMTWRELTEAERQHFANLFVQVLRDAVACRFNEYSTTQVFYLSNQREGNFAEVRTVFLGAKIDTTIDIRLVNRSGHWLMYDAVIDGVSLVNNYQAQFLQVVRDFSYAGLIAKLEAKTLLPKNFEHSVSR